MTAEEKFTLMMAAMIGDDEWVALVEDEIAHEDSIEWLFAPVDDEEPWPLQPNERMMNEDAIENDYEDDMLDREFWARGQW